MPREKKSGLIITAAIFIVLEFAAFEMLKSSQSLQNIWLTRGSHRILTTLWKGTETTRNYFNLKEENDRLANENFALSERIHELESLHSEEEAAGVRREDRFEYTPATIVRMSRNSQHNYIIVNKGFEDGVKPASGIITGSGVVGIISAVDRHYSYGRSLMNSRISVSARIGREGIVAPMSWDGRTKDGAFLTDVPFHASVAPGDTVYTSGQSDIFPGGIPLGITEETESVAGSSTRVKVRLLNSFSSLHYVTLCHNPYRGEIEKLEKEGEGRK